MQKRFIFILSSLLVGLLLSSCGIARKATKSTSDTPSGEEVYTDASKSEGMLIETGVSSWYGPNFHGKLTANGEIYDMDGITAAHRTLPFNSIVLVENLDNGKSLQVRINDRGPYAKDRILDLSRGAARKLGVIGPGTANIKLYLLNGDLKNSRITDLKVPNYTIQLGSYKKVNQAKEQSSKIKNSRVESIQVGSEKIFRVYYGRYTDANKAKKELSKLKRKGFAGFVKQIENG
ncbi:MAG: septal ring lytic transglycosylase RlpA family protein [Balneolaceae bacterium]|nr:septal ring lytic transglycosylase RlpA family protein [Balneolaceae bacterium]